MGTLRRVPAVGTSHCPMTWSERKMCGDISPVPQVLLYVLQAPVDPLEPASDPVDFPLGTTHAGLVTHERHPGPRGEPK